MTTPPDLVDRVAVVTGSSSGIGRAIALEFARAGAHVIVHCHRGTEAAEQVAKQVRALGRQSLVIARDLADPKQQDELVEEAWNWRQFVDVWVNNAGADVLTGTARDQSFEQKLETLWRVDVVGTIRVSRLNGERMRKGANPAMLPAILNMGWDQAELGMGGESGEMFAASKGAIMAFTRSLAQSLAPQVRVNCLAPGWIRTSWGEQASDYWQNRATSESLLGRWGTPEDVAQAARFVVSPAASFMTGQTIFINGGFRRRDGV